MPNQPEELQNLMNRIAKLERDNRRFKWGSILVTVFACSIFIMGQVSQKPRVIEAESFIVRDSTGKMRANFGIFNTGHVGIALWNTHNKNHFQIALPKYGKDEWMQFFDENGKSRFSLGTIDNNMLLRIRSEKDENRVLALGEMINDGVSNQGVWLFDKGKSRANVVIKDDGNPVINLYDNNQISRLTMGLSSGRAKDNSVAVGDPILTMSDPNGKMRASLAVAGYYGNPLFFLTDENNNILFSKP